LPITSEEATRQYNRAKEIELTPEYHGSPSPEGLAAFRKQHFELNKGYPKIEGPLARRKRERIEGDKKP
jgi:hypothetical protein